MSSALAPRLRRPCIRCNEPLLTMGETFPHCTDADSCARRMETAVKRVLSLPEIVRQSIPGYKAGPAASSSASADVQERGLHLLDGGAS